MGTSAVTAQAPAGVLLVDKPAGITSHDVVARVRRIFNTRKVGHAGTLDPMATGVLVLGINSGTRLLGHLTTSHKRYLGTIRLGAASSTDDREGELGPLTNASELHADEIEAALDKLRGEILQRPSSVSAIKIDGRRAYARVRDGQVVEIPERNVTVFNLEVAHIISHGEFLDIEIDVAVSSGTYIRAIARDLGDGLGVGGHLIALRRTSVAAFDQKAAHNLDLLESAADPWVHALSLAEVAGLTWPIFDVGVDQGAAVRMGQRIPWPEVFTQPTIALIDPEGTLAALAHKVDERCAYIAVFSSGAQSPSTL